MSHHVLSVGRGICDIVRKMYLKLFTAVDII